MNRMELSKSDAGGHELCIVKRFLCGADMPSAPAITRVQPYSSTAQVFFEEPESTGGVPVLKYRAEWRTAGRGSWVQRIYQVKDGEFVTRQAEKESSRVMWNVNITVFGL